MATSGGFKKDDPRINREGRPEGTKNFTTKVREALETIAEGKDYTYEAAFIKSILKKAIVDGDASTQRLIWNYLDGLPAQKMDITSLGEQIYGWNDYQKNNIRSEILDKAPTRKPKKVEGNSGS